MKPGRNTIGDPPLPRTAAANATTSTSQCTERLYVSAESVLAGNSAAVDWLTTSPGQTYSYYPNGALKQQPASGTPDVAYAYNDAGLLSQVTSSAGTVGNVWDHADRRVALTTPGGDTWQFVYDPTANVPAVLAEVKNGDLQAFYVREPGGELIARVAGEDRKYYFFDGLGSVMAMAPAVEGNPTDRYFYTPWGEPDARAQSLSATTGNPYRYVGQLGYYFHHQIPALQNWLQLGVRFYDPEAGRFERRDPLPTSVEAVYTYAHGNPQGWADPSGLQADSSEREQKYRQCLGAALQRFSRCVAETFGTHDIAGAVVGCLAGCAAVSAWNGELTWPVCAVSCTVGGTCYGAYTLVRTYFCCVRPYQAQIRECDRLRRGGR